MPAKNENPTENIPAVDMHRNSHHRADGRGETVGEIAQEGSTVRGRSAEWRRYDRAEDDLASIQKYRQKHICVEENGASADGWRITNNATSWNAAIECSSTSTPGTR